MPERAVSQKFRETNLAQLPKDPQPISLSFVNVKLKQSYKNMILYRNSSINFRNDVDNNAIADKIEAKYVEKFGRKSSKSEYQSWNNSMKFMETIVRKSEIPNDCEILIEYNIPS
ncbi:MAG: hypothetical protein K6G15_06050, partial [Desulfovibrio sp.]|nr:hypothetical protein [Desulfovibrio sp.]